MAKRPCLCQSAASARAVDAVSTCVNSETGPAGGGERSECSSGWGSSRRRRARDGGGTRAPRSCAAGRQRECRRDRARARRARTRSRPDRRLLPRSRRAPDRDRDRRAERRGGRPRGRDARGLDRLAAALLEGHRARRALDRRPGGRAREAHRARRPRREAADGGGEPPPRRLDCEEVPQSGPALPRPDPGGHDRPRPRRGEVRLPQGLQVLDLRHVVDPPSGGAGARGQGAHDPDAGARGREAEQDRPRRAEAARRARSGAVRARNRPGPRPERGRGGAHPPQRADARVAREAGRRRGGVRVRALPHRRERAPSGRGRRGHVAEGDASGDPREPRAARARRARASLRPRRPAPAHARRGGADVQRHPRADPADREPEPEEAAGARRRAEAARSSLDSRAVDAALQAELGEFLRIPSISAEPAHADDVRRAGEWVCDYVRAVGGTAELAPLGAGYLALGELRASSRATDAPVVLVYGHFDVQPPAPLELWESDPFELAVRDGWAYARGIADDKGQLYVLLKAATELAREGALPVNVRVACDGEEEIGGHTIVDFLATDDARADACVIFDAGFLRPGMPAFCIATRGVLALEIAVTTGRRDLHSGLYGGAALNAIHVLVEGLAALFPRDGRLPEPLRQGIVPPTEEELAGWKELPPGSEELAGQGARPLDARAAEEFYIRTWAEPSLDVNGILGGKPGVRNTTISARASAELSIRIVPGQDVDTIAAAAERLLREAMPEGAELEVRR